MNKTKTKLNCRMIFKMIILLSVMTFASSAMAYMESSFPGWDLLVSQTPNIFIARCNATPDPYKRDRRGHSQDFKGLFDIDIQIISILKGTTNGSATNSDAAHLTSSYWPRQGEYYLIFSNYKNDDHYQAIETYRIVPLGAEFSDEDLSGKTLDEQVQYLLKLRLERLERQMKEEQEEKERLEEGIKN